MTDYQLAGLLIGAAAFVLSHLAAALYWYSAGRRRGIEVGIARNRSPRALR